MPNVFHSLNKTLIFEEKSMKTWQLVVQAKVLKIERWLLCFCGSSFCLHYDFVDE